MTEREPIDELFARALRDATAAPPAQVWEGIVRERGWAHVTLVRLQRRWGLLAFLLLLGGAGAYWGARSDAPPILARSAVGTPGSHLDAVAYSEPERNTVAMPVAMNGPTPANVLAASAEVSGNKDAEEDASYMPESTNSASRFVKSTYNTPVNATEHAGTPTGDHSVTHTATVARTIDPVPYSYEQMIEENATASTGSAILPTESEGNPVVPGQPFSSKSELNNTFGMVPEEKEGKTSNALVSGTATFLHVRRSELLQELSSPAPVALTPSAYAERHRAWWVAATMGQFRETRTWHGADAVLVDGLQSTELPHYPVGSGVLVGFEDRSGWGMAVGLEYNAGRYTYRHLDQFVQRTDSLVPFLVTFNSDVIQSYSDTLTTYAEKQLTVAAENRYTTFRFPVEASWHTGWRRWHVGVRAGPALEVNTQRAGVTLVETAGGAQSVDVATAPVERTSIVLTGSIAADVGFGLTERIGIWVSPTYGTGLRSLSVKGDASYAMPERLGLRFRLAYTLCPRP